MGVVAMRQISRATIATWLSLVLIGTLPATSVWAWDGTCNSGEVCNWSNGPFVAPIAATPNGDNNYSGDVYPGTSQSLNDSVSSVRNRKASNDVLWYPHAGYGGTPLCLDAGTQLGVLGSWNDVFSSHLIAANNTC
jgi:hypothetical protein